MDATTEHRKATAEAAVELKDFESLAVLGRGGFGTVYEARSPKGEYCGINRAGVLKDFTPASQTTAGYGDALAACEAYCSMSEECNACSVDGPPPHSKWVAIKECGPVEKWAGGE